ncbi:alpha beta hydrolase protein [Rutstroemia sp. NJR-2017a BVV2]|nr:alpha beta hydrolase protein [Rutstroemia sp. NJR-2017a BVV2]
MANSEVYELSPDTHLNVLSSGSPKTGPTLIFLHFWGGSSRTYIPLMALLAPNYHTIAIDFRGWGSSTGPASKDAYHVHNYSADVQALLPQLLPPSQPFILAGHSMGAKVAMHLAACIQDLPSPYPQLQALILLAPAPPSPLILPEEMSKQQITAYFTLESATYTVTNILSSTPLPHPTIDALASEMVGGNEHAKTAWPSYGMKEDYVEEARKIHVSTLIVAGGGDRVETLERVREEVLGNLRGVEGRKKRMRVLDGVGHLLMLEATDRLREEIEEFVNVIYGRDET